MSQKASGEAVSSTDSKDIFSTIECPTCGRDDFASNEGMRRHHAIAHGESISYVESECNECGSQFEIHHAWLQKEDNSGRYCSPECRNEARRDDRELRDCTYSECANKHLRLEQRSQKYCSRKCAYLDRRGKHTQQCEVCGEEYATGGPKKAERRVTCSRECRSEWYTGRYTGEDNFSWKGGYNEYYGDNWEEMRSKTRQRDDYTCQVCRIPESEYSRQLSVHHIFPVRKFDEPEEANNLLNLVTMCEGCHSSWEGLYLRPDTRGDGL